MTTRTLDKVLEFMRVLWALDHALQQRSKAMGAELGVTSPQRLTLKLIAEYPGSSSGEVAELLHLDPSTLTGVLQRLQRGGLLARKKDPADARRVLLEVTKKGAAVLRRPQPTVEGLLRGALAAEKPKAVRKTTALLQRLTAALTPPSP